MNVDRGLPTELAFANQEEIKSIVRMTLFELQVRLSFLMQTYRHTDTIVTRCGLGMSSL